MCPEKTIEGHNLSPLTDLDALYKQRVKTIAELKISCQSLKKHVPSHRETLSQGWDTYQFHEFKEICLIII